MIGVTASAQNKKLSSSKNINYVEQIKKLERIMMTALYKRDTAAISKILDDNFITVEPDRTDNKQEQLWDIYESVTSWMQKGIVTDSFHLEDMIVHQYGNSAVSTFVKAVYGKDMGYPFTRKVRYQNMWVKQNGTWKEVSSQTARVSADTKQAEQTIKALILEREIGRYTGDKSIGKRILDPTYTFIDEIGNLQEISTSFNTANDTAAMRRLAEQNKEMQYKTSVDSFHFQFYDNTAIVKYRLIMDLVFNGEPCHKVFQCNEVMMKGVGNWRSVSHSETVIPGKPFETKIDKKVYDDYVGRYQLFSTHIYNITKQNDKLYLGTKDKTELVPENENTFVMNGKEFYRIKFLKDEKGNVTQMRWIEFPGVEYSAIKVH